MFECKESYDDFFIPFIHFIYTFHDYTIYPDTNLAGMKHYHGTKVSFLPPLWPVYFMYIYVLCQSIIMEAGYSNSGKVKTLGMVEKRMEYYYRHGLDSYASAGRNGVLLHIHMSVEGTTTDIAFYFIYCT